MGYELKKAKEESPRSNNDITLKQLKNNKLYDHKNIKRAFDKIKDSLGDDIVVSIGHAGLWAANATDGLRKGGLTKENIILQIYILFYYGLEFVGHTEERCVDAANHIYEHLQEAVDSVIQDKKLDASEKRVNIVSGILEEALKHTRIEVS